VAEDARTIRVQAAVEHRRVPGRLVVSITESGETGHYALVDDGSVPGDIPMDGLWTAVCPIGQSRFVEVELTAMNEVGSSVLYHRVVHVPAQDEVALDFFLESTDHGLAAHRVPWLPSVGSDEYLGGEITLTLAFGWGFLVLLYVGFLVLLGRKR